MEKSLGIQQSDREKVQQQPQQERQQSAQEQLQSRQQIFASTVMTNLYHIQNLLIQNYQQQERNQREVQVQLYALKLHQW